MFFVVKLPMVKTYAALISACLWFTACQAAESDPELRFVNETNFDINDVSFLYPLPASEQGNTLLKLSDEGGHGPLLREPDFEKLPLLTEMLGDDAYAKMRIVSARLDLCAPKVPDVADAKACPLSLIRLVAQPVTFKDDIARAEDAAIHLVYQVELSKEMVEELGALKETSKAADAPTDGVALGIHPALAKEKGAGIYTTALGEFLLKHVGQDVIFASSAFATFNAPLTQQTSWKWAKVPLFKSRVVGPGDEGFKEAFEGTKIITAAKDPSSGEAALEHVFSANGSRAGSVEPASLGFAPLTALVVDDPPGHEESAAYNAAYRIENPRSTIIPAADCASCHLATPYRLAAEKKHGVFKSAEAFPAIDGITGKMDPAIEADMATRLYVVLNFAHLFTKPAVSQRTVNESVEMARFLNEAF